MINTEPLSYPDNESPSLWKMTASAEPDCSALNGTVDADVVIIGAGFTGLSAALHLAERGGRPVVLDRGGPGWGGSGRNGGQVNPGWRVDAKTVARNYGRQRVERIMRMPHEACDLVFALVERFNIDCTPLRKGFLTTAIGEAGRSIVRSRYDDATDKEVLSLLDAAETASLTGSQAFSGGLLDHGGGSVHPLSFAHGLAQAAIAAGARIFAPATAERYERDGASWRVITDNGAVKAGKLILATNGYSDNSWPNVARTVVPVASAQIASAVLPESLQQLILPGGQHASDTRNIHYYFRKSPDGRFVIGGRGSTFGAQKEIQNRENLQAEAISLYPELATVKWPFYWVGNVAMTMNKLPHLLELGPNAYAGLGYNGRGVALATLMGKYLAATVHREEVPLQLRPAKAIPFHSFAPLGVAAYIYWGRMKDAFAR
jgi:glycine/D-amino acid oxidase-like deaminating enzyme